MENNSCSCIPFNNNYYLFILQKFNINFQMVRFQKQFRKSFDLISFGPYAALAEV